MRRIGFFAGALGIMLFAVLANVPTHTLRFDPPIDAVSFAVPTATDTVAVRARLIDGTWTSWQTLVPETEFDPLLRETSLAMFPAATDRIEYRSAAAAAAHPIRISTTPVSWQIAATQGMERPRILSRAAWGADPSYLLTGEASQRSDIDEPDEQPVQSTSSNARVQDCLAMQQSYADEFRTQRVERDDAAGNRYRWARQYSPSVRLLVVHHTALSVDGDRRSGVERMRALYSYHANNRGWGDIGYHYVIDETGQIYEGRSGGDYVVGGHAYCNNVGTVGIALMGNFDIEQPTQDQMRSLQWLLRDLSDRYDIDPSQSVEFHGTRMQPIVGHGDLLSTDCPGYYVAQTLSQVRSYVAAGRIGTIRFPSAITAEPESRSALRREQRLAQAPRVAAASGLSAVGSTRLEGRPGGTEVFLMQYRAGSTGTSRRERIADIVRSSPRIGVWQELDGRDIRVRDELILPESVRAGGTATLRLRVQFPATPDDYTLTIGDTTYTLSASGRRARTPVQNPVRMPAAATTPARRASIAPSPSLAVLPTDAQASSGGSTTEHTTEPTQGIRIRLSYDGASSARLEVPARTMLGTTRIAGGSVFLSAEGGRCVARQGNRVLDSGIVRLDASDDSITIASWDTPMNRFRGIIECRILENRFVLINELPLEDYMAGLAEEPDTEPYEKQRAFAIAARSYAAHYMQPGNRKFPGMPYDGDDSPARFQKYGGVAFEERNAGWQRAVRSTAHRVLQKDGDIVKAAYFSSSDGRTRSPAENGWNGFPHEEVFSSKPDPWCNGMDMRGHGVGMSGCGAKGQALEGRSAEEILAYYYPGTMILGLQY